MKKLKPIAYELINIKKEMLNNSYSDTIKRALEMSIDQILEKGFIDLNTQLYLKDSSVSTKDFAEYLHSIETFKKDRAELEVEFEQFIENLIKELCELGLDKEEFSCSVDLDNEKIRICKIFSLKQEFLKDFFYFEEDSADEYLEKLMRRKGFVEKFAILRLPRILYNFIESCQINKDFKLEKSYPYFDSKYNCYSIDLVFEVDLYKIEKDSKRKHILETILSIINDSHEYFKQKMKI